MYPLIKVKTVNCFIRNYKITTNFMFYFLNNKNQFEGIEKWLADMTDYLDSVSRAHLPSVPVIQAQLQESCEALNDMKTLKPTLQKVDEVAHRLLEYFSPAYAEVC